MPLIKTPVPNWVDEGSASWTAASGDKTVTLINPGKNIYMVVFTGVGNVGSSEVLRFNGDSGANYSYRNISTTGVTNSTGQTGIVLAPSVAGPISTVLYFSGVATNSTIGVGIVPGNLTTTDTLIIGGTWSSASNVTSVTINASSTFTGKFHVYSLNI